MTVYHGEPLKAEEQSLVHAIGATFQSDPDALAVLYRREGNVVEVTYRNLRSQVERVAAALLSMGLERGQRALIMSETRYEWLLADLAILFAGGVTVTAFPTLPPHLLKHHIEDSGSSILFLEGEDQVLKLKETKLEVEPKVILFEAAQGPSTLSKLLEREPGPSELQELHRRAEEVKPGDVASIIYTSGTTGVPKGALLTHWNIASAALSGLQVLGAERGEMVVAFLPMAHIYQRLVCLGMLMIGGTVAFSTPRSLADDLLQFKPHHMAAVPRLYERVYDRVLDEVERQPGPSQRIYRWSERVALEYSEATSGGRRAGMLLRLKHQLADRLVYRKIRAGLGGRLRYAMSGASALPRRLAHLFNGMGIRVLEGYGLTETAAPANLNPPDRIKPGTVGPPIPGVIETLTEDGEILIKGPNVFIGYNNLPEETKSAFTEDGWFRSGDLGEFDEDGYLRILGRKKHILALSTGKKVAPRPIEEALRASPWVGDCMLLGENRKFTAAIIQPHFDRLLELLRSKGVDVREDDLVYGTTPAGERIIAEVPRDLVQRPEIVGLFEGVVEKVNSRLDYHEKIKRFLVLHRAFSFDRGEITPTLKKRRDVIEANLKEEIAELYA